MQKNNKKHTHKNPTHNDFKFDTFNGCLGLSEFRFRQVWQWKG